jgi:hypothetical protein
MVWGERVLLGEMETDTDRGEEELEYSMKWMR